MKEASESGFAAYAATFDVDKTGDQFTAGCFKKSLEEWDGGKNIPVLWNHNTADVNAVVALTSSAVEDDKGLKITAVYRDTEEGKKAASLVKSGAVYQLSIGFEIKDGGKDGDVFKITEAKIREFSLVFAPANDEARIIGAERVEEDAPEPTDDAEEKPADEKPSKPEADTPTSQEEEKPKDEEKNNEEDNTTSTEQEDKEKPVEEKEKNMGNTPVETVETVTVYKEKNFEPRKEKKEEEEALSFGEAFKREFIKSKGTGQMTVKAGMLKVQPNAWTEYSLQTPKSPSRRVVDLFDAHTTDGRPAWSVDFYTSKGAKPFDEGATLPEGLSRVTKQGACQAIGVGSEIGFLLAREIDNYMSNIRRITIDDVTRAVDKMVIDKIKQAATQDMSGKSPIEQISIMCQKVADQTDYRPDAYIISNKTWQYLTSRPFGNIFLTEDNITSVLDPFREARVFVTPLLDAGMIACNSYYGRFIQTYADVAQVHWETKAEKAGSQYLGASKVADFAIASSDGFVYAVPENVPQAAAKG